MRGKGGFGWFIIITLNMLMITRINTYSFRPIQTERGIRK